jgi:hypothetical protein
LQENKKRGVQEKKSHRILGTIFPKNRRCWAKVLDAGAFFFFFLSSKADMIEEVSLTIFFVKCYFTKKR